MWIERTVASGRQPPRRRCAEAMRRPIVFAVFLILGLVVLLAPWPMFSPAGGEREILVRARQYAYDPGVIRVPKGARITLVLESEDVTHGLYLDGYDIDLATAPGRRVRTSFVADRAGDVSDAMLQGVRHPSPLHAGGAGRGTQRAPVA